MANNTVPVDDMMVLTEEGLVTLVEEIFNTVNARIGERIVGTIGASDTTHTPNAAAVYNALNNVQHIMPLVIKNGDINSALVTRDTKTLYLVRTTADAKEGVPYVWISEEVGFVACCSLSSADTNPDLKAMDTATIQSAVSTATNNTKPDLTA